MVNWRVHCGGIVGVIGKTPQGPGNVTFYIGVDDAEAALKQVERLGGKTIQPPIQVPGGVTFALFADPEGHVVGLVKERPCGGISDSPAISSGLTQSSGERSPATRRHQPQSAGRARNQRRRRDGSLYLY